MEPVRYSHSCRITNTPVHHISAAGHYKAYVLGTLQDFCSRLYEIFGSFLESNSSQEGYDLIPYSSLDADIVSSAEIHSIMYSHNFIGVYTIFCNDDISRQIADCYYPVSKFHPLFLNFIYPAVDIIATAPVKRGSMDMDNQRLT